MSETNQELILRWTAPALILQFIHNNEVNRGVYVWGFTIADKLIPNYVGIADNIITRIYQHITCILSGQYTIYHKDSLANFKEFKNKDAKADNQEGKLYYGKNISSDPSLSIALELTRRFEVPLTANQDY